MKTALKVGVIGIGNMGGAIADALAAGSIAPHNLWISDINTTATNAFKHKFTDVHVTSSQELASAVDILILAVKPWLVETVLSELSPKLSDKQLLISIAAGVDFETLGKLLPTMPLFRIIPNTAIAVHESMSFIAAHNATEAQAKVVVELFEPMGKTMVIPESLMTAATSLASCGIAYALRYLRAASEGGVELGFTASAAHQIVAQTMVGAAQLILQQDTHPEAEIDKVCTPGGWTIKGLNAMEEAGFTNAVIQGILTNK